MGLIKTKINFIPLFVLLMAGYGILKATGFQYSGRQIRQQVEDYVKKYFSQFDASFRLDWLGSPPDVYLLNKPDSVAVSYKGKNLPVGNQVFQVSFFRRGLAIRTVYLSTNIHVFRKVWVAQNSIQRNEPLDTNGLQLMERDLTTIPGAPLAGSEHPARWIARRTIPAGSIIMENDVRTPYLIRRGNRLKVRYQKGAVLINLQARAMQDGEKDDIIWIRNPDSGKRMRVKVVGPDAAVIP